MEILKAACCVAAVDRSLSPDERELLQALAEHASIADTALDAIIARALADRHFLEDQLRLLHEDPIEVIAILILVASADGKFSTDEHVLIRYFAGQLDLSDQDFERARRIALEQDQTDNV